MIKQLLNSAIAKYRDLSVARRSITCLCLRHRQIIDLLATDKSRYFAQSRPIIVYYVTYVTTFLLGYEYLKLYFLTSAQEVSAIFHFEVPKTKRT